MLEMLDPFGQRRDDYRLAYGLSVIVNTLGRRKSDGSSFRPADFMADLTSLPEIRDNPEPPKEEKNQSVDAMERMIEVWVRGSNRALQEGRVKKRGA